MEPIFDKKDFIHIDKDRLIWPKVRRVLACITSICLFFTLSALVYLAKDLGVLSLGKHDVAPILNWIPYDNTVIFDRDDQPIAHLYRKDSRFIPLSSVPEQMVQAILATEDRRFWEHSGVDLMATFRAAIHELTRSHNSSRQGGSTITQQLVRNFLLTREKTIIRKIKEIALALTLEQYMGKERILELYLNTLFLGSGAYGLGSAASRYFNRPLSELNLGEQALLAGLFQSPSRYNPHKNLKLARRRQKKVLKSMVAANFISRDEAQNAWKEKVRITPYTTLRSKQGVGYFKDFVVSKASKILQTQDLRHKGLRIYTTLNLKVQKQAEKILNVSTQKFHSFTAQGSKHITSNIEAALVATNPRTGEILAMQGGTKYTKSNFNRASESLRQPGSLFKPVVYAAALEAGYRWNDTTLVAPVSIGDNYRPRNISSDYLTETTLLRSFYRSMNAPTVELGAKLGLKHIQEVALKMGLSRPLKNEFGSILGSSEVSMLDIATLYGTIANQCRHKSPFAIRKITSNTNSILFTQATHHAKESSDLPLDPRICFSLSEAMRLVLSHGTARSHKQFSKWSVGKTGTTNGARDNWFAGFSKDILAVVWVGSDDSKDLLTGSSAAQLALPIWADFMQSTRSLTQKTNQPIDVPDGVHQVKMNPNSGVIRKSGTPFWFLEEYPPRHHDPHQPHIGTGQQSFRAPKLR